MSVRIFLALTLLGTRIADAQIEDGRLPGTLAPSHYDVTVKPDIYTGAPPFGFTGNVTIFFRCQESTSSIYLSQFGLEIEEASIRISADPDNEDPPPKPVWNGLQILDDIEMLEITLENDLVVGASYVLEMSYSGRLAVPGGWPDGLFYDSYIEDGQTKYMASTNFYPRQWMPCFDEPSYKATFTVTVAKKGAMTALMNTPLIEETPGVENRRTLNAHLRFSDFPPCVFFLYLFLKDEGQMDIGLGGKLSSTEDGWVYASFETTPIMAPYVVCFFVGEFDYLEVTSENGVRSRVWSRPDIIHTMEFSSMVAAKMIDWFENWTNVSYPINKMDHIAIPSMGGAMENLGLILYGERSLAHDPQLTTEGRKSGAAHIVSHELAHQWFGNLVTYAWWDEAWLNEGFSSFFEYAPFQDTLGWNGDELHLMDDCWGIMDTDSTNRSQPVRIQVVSPWQRWNAFSGQAYEKGGCVVRMIRQILGESTFQKGVSRYLKEHALGNVVTDDLFASLDQQAAEDGVTDTDGSPLVLSDKLYSFLNQMGFPVVTATRDPGQTLELTQRQFQNPRDAYAMPDSEFDYAWNVPVTIATSSNPDFTSPPVEWMNRENVSQCCRLEPGDDWFLINNLGGSFLRLQYEESNHAAVRQQLATDPMVISPESRGQFVQDTVKLIQAGYAADLGLLEISAYLDQEDNLMPWRAASRGLDYPALVLRRFPETDTLLKDYIVQQTRPLYDELGFDFEEGDDAHVRKLLRVLISELACASGNEDCIATAQQLYDQWMDSPEENSPVPDLSAVVSCSAVAAGQQPEFDFALAQYREIVSSEPSYLYAPLRTVYINSLACATEEEVLNGYIALTFDPEVFPSRDTRAAMTAIASSPAGRDVMWRHLQENWDNNPVPSGVTRGVVLQAVVSGFSTQEDLAEFDAFTSLYPPANGVDQAVYDQARATLIENVAWTDENQSDFQDWLVNNARRNRNIGR